ncbi:MAG: FGGY family carbohydrate kinase, partial [Chloroflexota bacterium]|nr:FGGY family carbohydrate kinase [Chloroflexota bacterium]
MRRVVLGVDSGTQSTKVLALDVEDGSFCGLGRAPHSGHDTQHPDEWRAALRIALAEALMAAGAVEPVAIAVAGQQHGCVLLDEAGRVVRPAPLWNNLDAAPDADRLNTLADFPTEVGLSLVASITIAKLAHLARTEPETIAKTAAVGLPHDWLTWRLTGEWITDRGDASGTGWWSPETCRERRDLLALAVGEQRARSLRLPRVLGPDDAAGTLAADAAAELGLPAGILVGAGTGDNMAGALGLGAATGEAVVSLGTSGTAYLRTTAPSHDVGGEVSGFAVATGAFLPLVCLVNCTRVVDSFAGLLNLDRQEALARAAALDPGAEGMLLLPLLGGERTPNLPHATGELHGVTMDNLRPEVLLRAALDGVAANLAYAVERLSAV